MRGMLSDKCPFIKEAKEGEMGWAIPMLGEEAFGGLAVGERRDAAESRRRILGAARALFEERGVDAVSMHEIGRAAGVGQGTLYRRFEHKGALCAALLGEEIGDLHEETRSRIGSGEGTASESLVWFLGRLVDFNERNAPLLGAIRDAAGGERRVEMYRNPFYAWLRATVGVLLSRAVEEEEIPRLDLDYLADVLLGALNIDLYLYQRHELGMNRERIVAALRGLLDGLRPC